MKNNTKRELANQLQARNLTFNPNWLNIDTDTDTDTGRDPAGDDYVREAATDSAVEEIENGFFDQEKTGGKVRLWIEETLLYAPDYLIRIPDSETVPELKHRTAA